MKNNENEKYYVPHRRWSGDGACGGTVLVGQNVGLVGHRELPSAERV